MGIPPNRHSIMTKQTRMIQFVQMPKETQWYAVQPVGTRSTFALAR